MQPVGLAERLAAEGVACERAQDHQRRHPLAVRRAFVDVVAAIGGGDRLDPFRALSGEILRLVQSAERVEPGDDVAQTGPS